MNDKIEKNALLSPRQQRELLKQLLKQKAQEPPQAAASCAQRRLWLVNRLEEPNPSYNVAFHIRLRGALDARILEQSLGEVVRRHAALRTTFREADGEPMQAIAPNLTVPVPVVDLTENPGSDVRARLKSLITEESEALFDIGRGPLIRAKLFRISSRDHVLVLVMHHIISDGWSVGVLVRELFTIYEAYRAGRDSPLPKLPIQYYGHAGREARWLQGAEFEKQLAYWTERLTGLPVLELPTDRRRPPVKGFRGATRSFVLDPSLSREIKQFSARQGVTPYMTLSAAFAVLLQRYARQDDIVFGSPLANRNRAELEGLIGFFANMLVMRVDLSGDPVFTELLARVSELTLGAYANQDIPFEQLVEKLRPERDPSRNPLFQVAIALHNEAATPPAVAGLDIGHPVIPACDASEFDIEVTTTRFDLELHIWEGTDGMRATWAFDAALFDAGTIDRMSRHLTQILRDIVENPGRRISELVMLTSAERDVLLREWGPNVVSYPRDATVHALFERQCAASPEATALAYGDREMRYGELNARANQLARYLERLGLRPGSLVGVCMERGADMIVALLGILKSGCAYVPLDPEYPAPRLKFMLEDTGAPVLVTQAALKQRLPEYAGQVLCLDQEWEAVQRETAAPREPLGSGGDLAYVMYTSGSTGTPKGVAIPHRGIVRLVRDTDYVQLGPDDRVVQAASVSFDAATFEIWGPLLNGGQVVGTNRELTLVPADYAAFLRAQKISVMFITTALFNQLAREAPDAFSGMRAVLFGGEAVDVDCVRRVIGRPQRLLHVYGPTECTTFATWHEVQAAGENDATVPIGRPIANTELLVLDDSMRLVPVGMHGELYIGGDGLAHGYWQRPELTAEKFVANPYSNDPQARLYRTGDLVRWREPGVIEFVGRVDHQVKLRGFRIELGEIEMRLKDCAEVRDAIVILREDGRGDKKLVAYVTPETGAALSSATLKNRLQEILPGYMVPSAIVVMPELPLNRNGKVDRKALPEPEPERQAHAGYVPPRDDLEREIADIWKGELGVGEIGAEDNFFDLGGHSLMLARVRDQIEKRLGRAMPIVTLFQYPTLRSLCRHLRDVAGDAPERPRPSPVHDQQLLPGASSYATQSIAVVGLSGRFPGARNLDEFWDNLRRGVESVRFFTEQELRDAGVSEASLRDPKYVRAKGYLEGADLFDARFFGYSPREATFIDPQQRLFLEVAWEALESAGYDAGRCRHAIGVYAGSSENTYWFSLIANSGLRGGGMVENALAAGKDFVATRVAYKMNLHGPAVTLQTACSTSLVAVHHACMSLLNGECGIAMAGGASISAPLVAGYSYEENSIGSPDGHCRAFDEAGQGTLRGEGVGVVVLKRLSDALADGDTIHAVIRGSAINNDGSDKVGYTAPSVQGQSQAIAAALAASGVDPRTIRYIETHGTGTTLGDPIEIAALNQAFGGAVGHGQIAIGSLKTNIGHLDAAAGVAGLIKTILAIEHGELPPSLHFTKPNPKLDIEHTPFYVNNRLRPWNTPADTPRRAGVSSFGIGGTNAHVVLEEAPPQPVSGNDAGAHQLLVLSARTPAALEQATANLAHALARDDAPDLADVAYTLQVGRKRFRHARILVCRGQQGAIAALQAPATSGAITVDQEPARREAVFLFSGQGSQHVDMGRDLYRAEPRLLFREIVDECCDKLRAALGLDLRELMYPQAEPEAAAERLTQTRYAQPALFVVEYALARQWMVWGVKPAAMLGHSIGEYVAACLADVMTLDDALALVAERGRLMYELPPGSMLSVPMAAGELQPLLGNDLSVATINGPAMSVVSGTNQAVDALQARLREDGIETKRLHTSHAFHSPMMEPILDEFTRRVRVVSLRAPQLPYVSNVTGDWITSEQATDPAYYAQHLRQAVRFSEGLERLFAHPDWVLLEVGPGQALCTLATRHPGRPALQTVVPSLSRANERKGSDEMFVLESLGRLWLAGVDPDWAAVHAPRSARRVSLPTYPFERQRYWAEPDRASAPTGSDARKRADVGEWFYVPSWKRSAPPALGPVLQGKRWLLFTDRGGLGERMARALRDRDVSVVYVAAGDGYARIAPDAYIIDPRRPDDYRRLFGELADAMPQRIVHLWAADATASANAEGSTPQWCEDVCYFSLAYLAQALGDRDAADPLKLTVVTTEAHDVTGSEALCPEKSMVLGPCRVIPTEYASVTARNVDIDLDAAVSIALLDALIAESDAGAAEEPVVAYRGPYRWVQSAERISLVSKGARLRDGGTYLITGGLGGVGLELAAWLARTARAKLVLVARSALPPRDEWKRHIETSAADDATRSKIERLLAIEEAGGEVLVCNADIADRAQMEAAIAAATARFGAIHGVVHSAGAAGGSVLQRQRPQTIAPVLAPKIRGTQVLDALFRDSKLDFMVLCSSLNTFIGLAGRADYLAANAYLDAFAHLKARGQGTPVIAVNWDTWVDVGMAVEYRASAGLAPHRAEEGMRNDEAVEAFRRILDTHSPQIIVSVREFDPRRLERTLNKMPDPEEEVAAMPATPAAASGLHPRPALANEYVAPRNDAERTLCAIWCELLGIDPIGIHDNFFELGGDSVVSIQVTARAKQKGIKLTPKQTFEHQTVAELAAVADVPAAIAADGTVASAAPAGVSAGHATRAPGRTVRVGNADIHDVEDVYDLSPMQTGMLFDGLAVNNQGMYRVFSGYHLHGELDIPTFGEAWRQVARRHAAIRTSIHVQGLEKPLQVVHREIDLPIDLIDLQGLPPGEQEQRVQDYIMEERAKPFDLGAPPLMQLVLFATGPRSYWFIWTIHHILVEGWSVSVILNDVLTTYIALRKGETPALPRARPYCDFIHWLQQCDYAESEAFWRQQLAGFTSPTPLPGGRGSAHLTSAVENYGGRKIHLPAGLSASLEAFAREHKLTLNTLMRAAWAFLLSRYSGERDIVFGTLVSGRSIPLEDVESTVGLFINLVPVRMQVPTEDTLMSWLRAIQAQQADIVQHEFCGLAQIKRWSEVPGTLPLFETLMIFENWAGDVKGWKGILEVKESWGRQVGQGYPLTLVVEPGSEPAVSIMWDERRIAAETALRLLEHFMLILERIPANPKSRVQDLPGLTREERRKLLGDWSGRDAPAMPEPPVHRLIEAQAERKPDEVAVAHLAQRLTYRELNERANRLAHHLIAMGVGPETIVGICLERSPDLIVGLLAVLKAGGAYLPLDPKYPAERLAFMLQDADVGIVVTSRMLRAALPTDGRKFVLLDADGDAIATRPATTPEQDVRSENLAYVIYTSGSTGAPKGVMIEHRALSHFVGAAAYAYALQPSDRVLQFATINFDAAVEEIFPCLARGATLVLRSDQMQYSLTEFVRRCGEWCVTVLDLPTAFWHELVDALDAQSLVLPPSLRLVIIGGEAALPERVASWQRRLGDHPRLVNTYGPTEATVVATLHDLSAEPPSDVVPIGQPLGSTRVYVLDDRREPVPIGAVGELYIGGAGLARGYLNRAELTAERFVPDPFAPEGGARLYRTGDLVRWREDGVLEYRGRADHQVKLRGHRIELGEIEAALARHPAVRDAVVLLRDDLAGPPGLVAYIVPRDADAPAADTLRGALRGRLPEYMLPAAFVVLDALPLLPSGKVDRAKLPPPDGRHAGPILVHPPQTETERGLAAIWCEALGLEQVSIHDNFFDIGGNSLVLMKVHALIARKHERDLSFVDLFEHTTIHALARLLDSGQAQTDDVPDTATRDARRQAGHQRLQARRARAQSSDTTTGSQL